MSNAVQVEPNQSGTANQPQQPAGHFSSDIKYVPGSEKPPEDELYAFRAALEESQEAEEAQPKPKPRIGSFLIMGLLALGLLGGLIYGGIELVKPKSPTLYIDLGTQRYDPAGLGGRLIAQWTGGAGYKFTIDPLDSATIPGFQATVANPPHAITFRVLLKDATDSVACQKDIVVPGEPQGSGAFDESQALAAHTSATGDTVQNVAGSNGQIGEMVITGSLPCNLDAYRKIVAWEFSTDFPPLSTQVDWEKHEDAVKTSQKGKDSGGAPRTIGGYTFVKALPTPIEADDVIVGDNPTKGIVATSSGRAFLVGASVLVNPALDWQVFPSDIHYRCEKTAMCMITHINSRTAVRAHLMK